VPPNLPWGDSRPYAVLQSTLDKDCRQAEEPKQLVDEASRFHLGRQCHHSAVICSGALLFSSRVLRPVWSRSANTSQVDVQLNSTMHLISGTLRSTPLPWLLVLSNIELPVLRRKAATDKLMEKIVKHDSWPIQPDILCPPLLQLTSRKPLWLDLQPVDIKSRWRHNWKSAQVVNSHLECDPTIRQPGFDLPRQQWSLLNHFCTEQGHYGARWCLTLSNPVPWQNWMAAYLGYNLWVKTLFRGWPVVVNNMHTRRRRLSHISTLTCDIDIANLFVRPSLSVCQSVRPSVTFRYQMKTA